MSSELPSPAPITAPPRPGVLQALGICNVVFAVLSMLCIGWSTLMIYAASRIPEDTVEVKVATSASQGKPGGVTMVGAFNPFMGFEDKNFIRFCYYENGVNLVINGLMFATGIGLLNRKRWAATGWGTLAWVRIVSVVIIWGCYIVAVAPSFSETMARDVLKQFAAQGIPANRGPSLADMTRIYSIMNLILAVGAMTCTSIYPAISLWLLSRPGVKAAIVDGPAMEPELP